MEGHNKTKSISIQLGTSFFFFGRVYVRSTSCFVLVGSSLINIRKNKGPRIYPCGTPVNNSFHEETYSLKTTGGNQIIFFA